MNHYDFLRVRPTASTDEIRAAYRARVKELHPDLPANNPTLGGQDSTREMARLNEVFSILTDPQRRTAYDQSIILATVNRDRITTWSDTYRLVDSLGHERWGDLYRAEPDLPRDSELFSRLWREAAREQRRRRVPFDADDAFDRATRQYRLLVAAAEAEVSDSVPT